MIAELLRRLTEVTVPLIDLIALSFIVFGVAQACFNIIKVLLSHGDEQQAARSVWMQLSRWLVAGLTFQLAADIIETATAPSWDDIGQLGAIAVIRTFLDFFLGRDQHEVRELQREPETPQKG
ncbi:DUF1622 domain-containing protein [Paraburkholderia aspalathi]|nr:DUF1622 domain-containing protein [Paraburkholderia aspalathi]